MPESFAKLVMMTEYPEVAKSQSVIPIVTEQKNVQSMDPGQMVNLTINVPIGALSCLAFRYFNFGIAADDAKLVEKAIEEVVCKQLQGEMVLAQVREQQKINKSQ